MAGDNQCPFCEIERRYERIQEAKGAYLLSAEGSVMREALEDWLGRSVEEMLDFAYGLAQSVHSGEEHGK